MDGVMGGDGEPSRVGRDGSFLGPESTGARQLAWLGTGDWGLKLKLGRTWGCRGHGGAT